MDRLCERIVWQVVPAVRKEIALALMDRGIKRMEIARALGISLAALTQYLKGKRGRFELPVWAREKIRAYVERARCINMCDICKELREDPRFEEMLGVEVKECIA